MGQIMGSEVEHLFAYMQFGAVAFLCYHVFTSSRSLGWVCSPPRLDSIPGAQPSLEQEGMQGVQTKRASSDLEAS